MGHKTDGFLQNINNINVVDTVLKIVNLQTGIRFVAVARVADGKWQAAAVFDDAGLGVRPGDERDIDTMVCKEVFVEGSGLAFDDVLTDPVYSRFPALSGIAFRAYCAEPIFLSDGTQFGVLCAMDSAPRNATDIKTIAVIQACAKIIGRLLDEDALSVGAQQNLAESQLTGGEREQFLAVVAHDLRNPLSTMHTAAEIMLRGQEPRAAKIGIRLKASAQRMTALIDDLVDYAKGRVGKAMKVQLVLRTDLTEMLEAIVDEARDGHPGREFTSTLDLHHAIRCDVGRLQQLLSNLLGNAVAYGHKSSPIAIEGYVSGGKVVLMISNLGEIIPSDVLSQVFEAFYRGHSSAANSQSSMGLGLSICMQIAQAHGGELKATSTEENGTQFLLEFPLL